jgi:uncharacterized protein YkwD
MPSRFLLAALALATFAIDAEAGPFRRRAQQSYQPSYPPSYQPSYQPYSPAPSVQPTGEYVTNYTPSVTPNSDPIEAGSDALDEVNAKRAARGLRPYVRDEGLTQAARSCAAFRAQHGLFGHTSNDFAFVPPGSSASSAGCAAYPASYGWMSCCVYEGYTYAGAAWVMGRDGQRYMHLFVR